jgi:hypothetical protein
VKSFRLILALAVMAGGFFLTGCAHTEHENMSERPWNSPKSWEHGMPTGMMPRY